MRAADVGVLVGLAVILLSIVMIAVNIWRYARWSRLFNAAEREWRADLHADAEALTIGVITTAEFRARSEARVRAIRTWRPPPLTLPTRRKAAEP